MAVFNISAMSARTPEEANEVSELIFKQIREDKTIQELYSLVPNITFDKHIPIIGLLSDIMQTKSANCEFPEGGAVVVTEKTWTPKTLQQEQRLCKDDTESKFHFWQSRNSNLVEKYDLTNSGELNYLIYLIEDAVKKAIVRVADFADTSAALVSGGGKITTALGATGVARMNAIDGLWSQFIAIGTANAEQLVAISENGEASKAAQLNLAADTAKLTFEGMILGASEDVPNDAVIMCTRSLFNNYFKWLVDNSFDTATAVEGMDFRSITLAQYGVTIIERKDWDRNIKSYFDNGTTYDLPHRAVMTSRDNLLIGTESEAALSSFTSHYSEDTMKNIVREEIKIDAKVALDEAVMVAY